MSVIKVISIDIHIQLIAPSSSKKATTPEEGKLITFGPTVKIFVNQLISCAWAHACWVTLRHDVSAKLTIIHAVCPVVFIHSIYKFSSRDTFLSTCALLCFTAAPAFFRGINRSSVIKCLSVFPTALEVFSQTSKTKTVWMEIWTASSPNLPLFYKPKQCWVWLISKTWKSYVLNERGQVHCKMQCDFRANVCKLFHC